MPTKAIIKITHCHSQIYRNGRTIYFLRLTDGTPADAGADAYEAAKRATDARNRGMDCHAIAATNYLLTRLVPGPGAGAHDPTVQLYRPVESPPADTRYFYEIDCPQDFVFVNFATGDHGAGLEAAVRPLTLWDLRDLVNDHRTAINLAVAILANQDSIFTIQHPYPMII